MYIWGSTLYILLSMNMCKKTISTSYKIIPYSLIYHHVSFTKRDFPFSVVRIERSLYKNYYFNIFLEYIGIVLLLYILGNKMAVRLYSYFEWVPIVNTSRFFFISRIAFFNSWMSFNISSTSLLVGSFKISKFFSAIFCICFNRSS